MNLEIVIIILFMLMWGIFDRIREIAVFPGWVSRIHEWFDTYYNPNVSTWWPFRDCYHTFKALPVLILFGLIWYFDGIIFVLGGWAAWAIGQKLGLLTRKKSGT